MHLPEGVRRNLKSIALPTAMVVGALLCRPVPAAGEGGGRMSTPAAS